jgi:hypothetical protein
MGTIKRAAVAFLLAGSVALNGVSTAAANSPADDPGHRASGGSVPKPVTTQGLPKSVGDQDHIIVCSVVGDGNCVVTTRAELRRSDLLQRVVCLVSRLTAHPFVVALCYSPIPLPPYGGVIIGGPSQQG